MTGKPEEPRDNDEIEVATTRDTGESPDAGLLDLSVLDLSVEKVEERISPSETNVFDK